MPHMKKLPRSHAEEITYPCNNKESVPDRSYKEADGLTEECGLQTLPVRDPVYLVCMTHESAVLSQERARLLHSTIH
jgi:hypothetical protein